MDATLSQLGVGALLAWVALPLFAWLVRPRARPDAKTLHRAQLAVLISAVGLLFVPWLPSLAAWLAPNGPYYQFEMRAILAPAPRHRPFEPRAVAAVLSPIAIIGAAWIIAVAVAVIRTVLGVQTVSRLLRASTPAPDALVELLRTRAIANDMRVPRLRISDRSAIPFATGLWQPAIVLPREFVDTLDGDALALVLEHELEHVRRGDLRSAAFVTLLKLTLGGHPTAEKLAREALLAREIAVDARVSAASPRAYATLLVDIAAHAHFGEKPAATAIDDTALARRIALISEPFATRPLSLLPLIAAGTAVVLCTLLARTFVSWAPAPPSFVGPGMAAPGTRPMVLAARTGFGIGPHGDPGPRVSLPPPGMRHAFHGPDMPGVPPPEPVLPELLAASPQVRTCYAQAAKADPEVHPHVMFAIDVSDSGVAALSVMARSAPDLATCLERAVKPMLPKLRLPRGANFVIGLDLAAPSTP